MEASMARGARAKRTKMSDVGMYGFIEGDPLPPVWEPPRDDRPAGRAAESAAAAEVVRAWFQAENARDWERQVELLAPDAQVTIAARSLVNAHPRAAQAAAKRYAAAFPDAHVDIENVVTDPPFVVVEWRERGTNTGTYAGKPGTGREFERTGMALAEVRNGRITRLRDVSDRLGLLEQIGRTDVACEERPAK
jgi:steroid delta-isomerase-like uncharacterized protein